MGWAQVVLGGLSAVIAGLLKADPQKWSGLPTIMKAIEGCHLHAFWLVPTAAVLIGALETVRRYVGSPHFWDVIHQILDEFRRDVFRSKPDASFTERVTLFRRREFYWRAALHFKLPWGGWLVPVERSGSFGRKCRSFFPAPDAAEHAEGVCGNAWARDDMLYVPDLPALTEGALKADIEAYAKRTFVAFKEIEMRVEQRRKFPRAMCGFRVRVKGVSWGAIVIESGAPEIGDSVEISTAFGKYAEILNKLLEKV